MLVNLAYRPGLVILRFLFYKVLVKAYQLHLTIIKRLGWSSKINKSFSFFINQKLIHIIVGSLTAFFIIFNLAQKTQAVSPEEMTGRTFLSEIISSEFSDNDQ